MKTKHSVKIISLLLVLCMSFGIFGISTSASTAKSTTSEAVSCYNAALKKTATRDIVMVEHSAKSDYSYDYSSLKPLDKFLTKSDNKKADAIAEANEDVYNYIYRFGTCYSEENDDSSLTEVYGLKEIEDIYPVSGKTGTVKTDKNGDKIITINYKTVKPVPDEDNDDDVDILFCCDFLSLSLTAKVSKDGYFKKIVVDSVSSSDESSRLEHSYMMESHDVETYGFVYAKVHPTSISINKKAVTLKSYSSATVETTVKPDNANIREVYWTTSDAEVAEANDDPIYSYAEGTATLNAYTYDGDLVDTCEVTVKDTAVERAINKLMTAIENIRRTIYNIFFGGIYIVY